MKNLEIVQKWGESTKVGDWATFEALTAENFKLLGPAPEPLDRAAYQAWIQSMLHANTEHDNNMEITAQSDTIFEGKVQMQGRHTGDWDLSFMGLGVIPATNKSWKNPVENLIVVVEDGKVVKCEVDVPADGGIPGIFSQLGVQIGT